jgi:tetratricopeptide (TPR) repeat protein
VFRALLLLLAASTTFEESFRNGLIALQRNDLAAAEANLEAAAKLAPGDGRVWVALAHTYWKLKANDRANAAAAKAESLGGGNAVVQGSLATYYAETGQMVKSAEAQGRYAAMTPGDAAARERAEAAYFGIAQPLLKEEKFAEAIELLGAATKNVKDSAQLELALGVAYYGLRRFDEAAGAFLKTVAIAPETPQPYLFLGKFLDQVPSRLPEITQKFIAYEAANPASPAGYYLHAKALNAQAMEPDTARKLLEKALSMNDRDAGAHYELGVALERSRQYADAARELERAAELAPEDAATHYRLARVYDRLGKAEAAQAERERHAKLEDAQRKGIR